MTGHEAVLFTRTGCHLCEEAKSVLEQHGLIPHEVDIDGDPQLVARYGESVPVVVIDGVERFRGHVNPILLGRLLVH